MKKRIILILVSMSLCVSGITGLQLFWNYQNYNNTVKAFKHDINDALNMAVNREIDQRHQKIITAFKGWLADTSIVQVTCDYDNRDSATVFRIKDTHSYSEHQKDFSLGFIDFKERIKEITPAAKAYFIERFCNTILRRDLKNGDIYYYTQRLGDRLSVAYGQSRLNIESLAKLYKEELFSRNIQAPFQLVHPPLATSSFFLTAKMNTALRRPYQRELVQAGFQSFDTYFIKEMKWLIVSSFLLIGITLFCFAYTLKTLLTQHKLAELKDDFINNMTHEINTPVSSIKITAEALKGFEHDRNARNEYLNIIIYQSEKLSTLTEQILSLRRIGQLKFKKSIMIELNSLIRGAIDDIRPQTSNALLNYRQSQHDMYIRGDASEIQNAFINILDNAIKYSEGTAIVDVRLSVEKKMAEIRFSDNGIGIPLEYQEKIFEKFFRVPKGNTHDVKGYGLGLNYVKQTIEQHKGSISVMPNKPQGSIFSIKIPLA